MGHVTTVAIFAAALAGCRWDPHTPLTQAEQARIDASLLGVVPVVGHPVGADLGGEITYVGLDAGPVVPGGTLTLVHVFEVTGLVFDWDLFVHVDTDQGGRINADHVPVDGLLAPMLWKPGQIVRDEHRVVLPDELGRRVKVYVGFYRGDQRLVVRSGPQDGANRLLAAELPVTGP